MASEDEGSGRSPLRIVKRSLSIHGHRTSISLEDAFWNRLRRIASARRKSVSAVVTEIDDARGEGNLSSAIRVAVLEFLDQ